MIGLQGAGLIIDNPDTLVGLGRLDNPQTMLALVGLVLMSALDRLGIKGSILITILGCLFLGGLPAWPAADNFQPAYGQQLFHWIFRL